MFNITETTNYDAHVQGVDTTDPVTGGVSGPANAGLTNLANRTNWLNAQLTALQSSAAPLNSPFFTGTPKGPNPATGDSSQKLATTSFVANAAGGVVTVPITNGTNTLTAAQYGCKVIILTGALTASTNVAFPNSGDWEVINRCTGTNSVTLKTATGSGYILAGGRAARVSADGTNVGAGNTDPATLVNASENGSGSYTALQSDHNTTIIFTAGTTLTLNPNNLSAGWMATFSIPATVGGTLTINPNPSATLDGVSSRAGMGGTAVTIYFDGSNFTTIRGTYIYTMTVAAGAWSNSSMVSFTHGLGLVAASAMIALTATCTSPQSFQIGETVTVGLMVDSSNAGATVKLGNGTTANDIIIGSAGIPVGKNALTFGQQLILLPADWSLTLTIETR